MVGHSEVMAENNSADTRERPFGAAEVFTLEEVSDMLRVHSNSIRRWNDTGLLPAVRIGECGTVASVSGMWSYTLIC